MSHVPVLLKEVIETLNPQSGQSFIDATVNGGGHALAILEKVSPSGKVLGIDWDEKIIENLKIKVQNDVSRDNLILINDSYTNLKQIVEQTNFGEVDGVLFDLGMSNWHIEESGRGFSFLRDEPLDMRFDTEHGQTAAELIDKSSEADLERIIREYGEERFAPVIARAIKRTQKTAAIVTTSQLVETIKTAVPIWYRNRRTHWATKTFQALRVAVNHEFENIESGIGQAIELVRPSGRVAVITFHSLEDRLVKHYFKTKLQERSIQLVNKKAIRPSWTEMVSNRKSRSAKLRVVEKL